MIFRKKKTDEQGPASREMLQQMQHQDQMIVNYPSAFPAAFPLHGGGTHYKSGLAVIDFYAAHALQGILSNATEWKPLEFAAKAKEAAMALIFELSKQPAPAEIVEVKDGNA